MNHLPELSQRLQSLIAEKLSNATQINDAVKLFNELASLAALVHTFIYIDQLRQAGATLQIPDEYLEAFNLKGG